MKAFFPSLPALALALFCQGAHAQTNLVVNGNFEINNGAISIGEDGQAPVSTIGAGHNNIGGVRGQVYDDLPNWSVVVGNGASLPQDYLVGGAQDPTMDPRRTPYCGSFTPHSGKGCIALGREPYSYGGDGIAVQQLGQSLVPGHFYKASFYALRRCGAPPSEKLSFSLINSSTEPAFGVSQLSPAPTAIVVSDPISDTQTWTLVTKTIQLPLNAPANSTWWVGVGYDRSVGPTDNVNPSGGSDYFAIDDVSLVEVPSCDITLDPYLPLNFCSNQTDRLFRIRNIAAGTPGFTFEWQFFKYDGSGLVPYGASGLPFTKTTQTSTLR